jgi:hypothetical protein
MGKKKQKPLFPELDQIVAKLRSGEQQILVILIVPSHDRDEKPVTNQDMWAQTGLDTMGEIFGGATSFRAVAGVYKSQESGRLLHDCPIMIESYVKQEVLEDHERVKELLRFCKRMGRETKQEAVALVVNNVFHLIRDFREA